MTSKSSKKMSREDFVKRMKAKARKEKDPDKKWKFQLIAKQFEDMNTG